MNFLVLHVRNYSFKDDNDRTVEGATVTYLDLTNEPEKGERGFAPLSISVTPDQTADFSAVPGLYYLQFRQGRGAKGRPRLIFHGATFRQRVDFSLDQLPTAAPTA